MAKKDGINKSEKIRELARQGLNAQGIVAELTKQGITVSKPSLYTNINKVKNAKGGTAKKAKSSTKSPATQATPSTRGTGFSADDIFTLAALAEKAGGLNRLGEIVTALGMIK